MPENQHEAEKVTEQILQKIIELTNQEKISWVYDTPCSHSNRRGCLIGFRKNLEIEIKLDTSDPIRIKPESEKLAVRIVTTYAYKTGILSYLHGELIKLIMSQNWHGLTYCLQHDPFTKNITEQASQQKINKMKEILKELEL